jgi:hypothetical protein
VAVAEVLDDSRRHLRTSLVRLSRSQASGLRICIGRTTVRLS